VKSGLQCFSCGIGIGPDYEESLPYKAGDKTLCSWCHGTLEKQGYIQLNSLQRLLPDGTVIKFVQKVAKEGSDGTGEGQSPLFAPKNKEKTDLPRARPF